MTNPKNWPRRGHEALNMSLAQGTYQKWFNAATTKDTALVFFAIEIINDTIFAALTDTNAAVTDVAANELSGITVPAGIVLYGKFSGVDLTSGVICAYRG